MNKITREIAKELNIDFNDLISDFDDTSYQNHRSSSNFFTRSIVVINEKFFPNVPRELDGFWETNTYVWDDDEGYDHMNIYELNRVEKKEKVVTTTYWEIVK